MPRGRRRWGLAAAAYVAYAVVVLSPVWSGSVEPKWDGRDFSYPAFAYAAGVLREGHLPLWNPYTNCGEPFISDPAYVWYQPAAIAAALIRSSPFDGYMLFWAVIWTWAGLGAFLLAAVLGAGPAGCVAAAISFSLSGCFVGHGQHLPYLVTAAWFPWVLAFAHLAVLRRSWAFTVLAGTAMGLSALGGYAGLVVFVGVALALWLATAFLVPWPGTGEQALPTFSERLRWSARVLAVSAALLFVIWSPSLYAFLVEARGFTERVNPLRDDLVLHGNPFPLRGALSFLFPRLVLDKAEWFSSDVSMTNAYIGALALPLAAVWAARNRRAPWLALFVAFWFLVSLGADGGLRTVLHYAVPPTRYMRHNGMLRVLFLAPVAAAAGAGLTSALSCRSRLPRNVTIVWVLVAFAVAGALGLQLGFDGNLVPLVASSIGAAAAGAAVLAWAASRPGGRWAAVILVAIFGLDLAWHLRTNSFTAWDPPDETTGLRATEARGTNRDPLAPRATHPVFRATKMNLVSRVPVVEGYVALVSSGFAALVHGRFSGVLARYRYWLSPAAWPAPAPEVGLAALSQIGPSEPLPVFVQGAPALAEAPVVPESFGAVRVGSYEPERVEMEVDVPGGADAIVASTERYAPSWRARVDGAERPIEVVNYFFRGVRVSPGRHRVVFEYAPRVFLLLFALSHVAIVGSGIAAVVRLRFEASEPAAGATLDDDRAAYG